MMEDLLRTLYRRMRRFWNRRDIETVKASVLFDGDWYLKQYPDVYETGMDPAVHYVLFGWRQRRDPGPYFRSHIYLALHPEAWRMGINPLSHHLRTVAKQTRNPRVEGDWKFLGGVSAASAAELSQTEPKARPGNTKSSTASIVRVSVASFEAAPLNIVLINYGAHDNNSGMHVCGFANALSALGHRVVVSAAGASGEANTAAPSVFATVSNRDVRENPGTLAKLFSGFGNGTPDLVHCWTPRPVNWSVVHAVTGQFHCPYLVHFEDNEMAVARAYGRGYGIRGASASQGVSAATPTSRLPPGVHEFVAGAAGATIIVDALRDVLPEGQPVHLLQPGVDGGVFAPDMEAAERARLCEALDVPADARIIVYPGNIHPANADDMFSLYAAIHALNARGHKVQLIRTGEDNVAIIDPRFAKLSTRYVTKLGWLRRERLIKILKLADFFVQPGGPDEFNAYRLPSKLPEFFALGRPVVLPRTNIGLLMQDRVNAILMERGDAAEITACVEGLIDDPALADRVGKDGRRFALAHFDWARSAEGLVSFYQQVLGR